MKQNGLLLLFAFLFVFEVIHAQVTIGSDVSPNKGTLLDLKEKEPTDPSVDNTTSHKGLGMPRVILTDVDKLKPMYTYADAATTPDTDAKKNHIGLAVYAVEKFGVRPNIYCPGLYVWDGDVWVPLNSSPKPNITMTDADGNVYQAKWFSADPCSGVGTYWTTSNIYSTQKKGGGAFTSGEPRLNPAMSDNNGSSTNVEAIPIAVGGLSTTDMISYGENAASSPTLNKTQSQKEYAKKFGLLYDFDQAQELCPQGWHLPTEQEWDDLRVAHGGNDVAGMEMRANINYFRAADGNEYKWGKNDSAGALLSGFNALPSGVITGSDGKQAHHFAYWAMFRSSSSPARTYGINYFSTEVAMLSTTPAGAYLSVRCVKD